jgi:endonuclease YncB( thermonuclease family)
MILPLRSRPRTAFASAGLAAAAFALGLATGIVVAPGAGAPTAAAYMAGQPVERHLDQAANLRIAHPAQVLRVLDGDTFEARVRLWPGLEITTKVRLRGIDAAELRAKCADERSKAEAARDALTGILAEGDVGIFNVTLDKYGGRVVASASTRTTADVSESLLKAGLVRAYAGGRRESWCISAG